MREASERLRRDDTEKGRQKDEFLTCQTGPALGCPTQGRLSALGYVGHLDNWTTGAVVRWTRFIAVSLEYQPAKHLLQPKPVRYLPSVVSAAVVTKSDMTPRSQLKVNRRFGGTLASIFRPSEKPTMNEASRNLGLTSVHFQRTTRRFIPDMPVPSSIWGESYTTRTQCESV
jgi:hypothetical protein